MSHEGGAVLSLVSRVTESQEDLCKLTRHHRKLKSDGGDLSPRNISMVPMWKHRAWHALYRDELPEVVDGLFKQDYEVFGTDTLKSKLMMELHQGWANNTREKIKRREAWYALFADMRLDEIVTEINTVWLDPDYEIVIRTTRILVPELKRLRDGLVGYGYS